MRNTVLAGRVATLLLACVLLPAFAGEEKPKADRNADGLESIFDGKTLDGWAAPDMSFWRVEDGAITGEVTGEHRPPENSFLVWQDGRVGDFVLTFRFRIVGDKANSGMQFRGEVKDRGLVHGYQADLSGDGRLIGNVFDEYGPRGPLAARGERVTWTPDGKKEAEPLPGGGDPFKDAPLDPKEWNAYRITAEGEHVTLEVNGVTAAELHDADPRHRLEGVLAMPVIPEPMKVQYKHLRLKRHAVLTVRIPLAPPPRVACGFAIGCSDRENASGRPATPPRRCYPKPARRVDDPLWHEQAPHRTKAPRCTSSQKVDEPSWHEHAPHRRRSHPRLGDVARHARGVYAAPQHGG